MLVFASWGDPYSWSKASYVLDAGECEEPVGAESPTSLAVLARYARCTGMRVRAVVVVQETLLAAPRGRRVRDSCTSLERGYPPPYKLADLAGLETGEASERYRSLLRGLERAVAGWAAENTGLGDVRVVVAPGVGVFRYWDCSGSRLSAAWRLAVGLRSNPFSFYASKVFLHAVAEMLRFGGGEPLTVAVDLTHGVNYTSTALYRAVLTAARVYASSTGAPVTVSVYNSEPFSPGVELRVWRIRWERVTPRAAASRLVYTSISGHVFPAKLSASLTAASKDIMRRAALALRDYPQEPGVEAAAAVIAGAPLLLLQAGAASEARRYTMRLLGEVAEQLAEQQPVVRVEEEPGNSVRVVHLLALDYSSVKAYIASLALNLYAANAYREEAGKGEMVVEEKRCGEDCVSRALATVEALEDVADSYLVTVAAYIVEQELSMLRKALKEAERGEAEMAQREDLYSRVYTAYRECKSLPVEEKAARSIDRRIFVAHAGLNSNIVDVACRETGGGRRVLLAYSWNAIPLLGRVSRDVLEELRRSLEGQPPTPQPSPAGEAQPPAA